MKGMEIAMKLCPKIPFVLLVCGCAAPSAFGQNFYWNTSGARSVALGSIYVPSPSDALDALAAKPAGLTALSRRTAHLSRTMVGPRRPFSSSVNTKPPLHGDPGALPDGAFGMPPRPSRFTSG